MKNTNNTSSSQICVVSILTQIETAGERRGGEGAAYSWGGAFFNFGLWGGADLNEWGGDADLFDFERLCRE